MKLNDKKLTKVAEYLINASHLDDSKYREMCGYAFDYAHITLIENLANELSTKGCATHLAAVFGSQATSNKSLADIVLDMIDKIKALKANNIYQLLADWKDTMQVMIDVL